MRILATWTILMLIFKAGWRLIRLRYSSFLIETGGLERRLCEQLL